MRWVREAGSDRPFVRLEDGRLALMDTGSGFGLGLNEARYAGWLKPSTQTTRSTISVVERVQSRRVAATNSSIGALVLNGVPTDVLTGVAPGTPIILGRRALFPFRITFDPSRADRV